jgi:light-regulated signal transduction histidine kinase (bacteriophytochrome)
VFEAYYSRAVVDPQGKLRDLDEQEKLRVLCESEGAALRFADAASVIRALILSERVWQVSTRLKHKILFAPFSTSEIIPPGHDSRVQTSGELAAEHNPAQMGAGSHRHGTLIYLLYFVIINFAIRRSSELSSPMVA